MNDYPWITYKNSPKGGVLTQNSRITDGRADPRNITPSLLTIVGRKFKTTLLEQLLGTPTIPVHQQVYLRALSKRRYGQTPIMLIDCGVLRGQQPVVPSSNSTSWDIPAQENVTATLTSRIFSPFSSVIAYFVSDLGGLKSMAEWLASQATLSPPSDLSVLPRILLVMDTASESFDESIATSRASAQLLVAMQKLKNYSDPIHAQEDIDRHFRDITVLGLKSFMPVPALGKIFKKRLLALSDLSMRDRTEAAVHFNLSHIQALTRQAIYHFSLGEERVPIAHVSRPGGFSLELFQHCLQDLLTQLPSPSWLWQFSAPLIASAILLSSYPPGAHGKHTILPRGDLLTRQASPPSFCSSTSSLHLVRRQYRSTLPMTV
jgi:hypothetical protein